MASIIATAVVVSDSQQNHSCIVCKATTQPDVSLVDPTTDQKYWAHRHCLLAPSAPALTFHPVIHHHQINHHNNPNNPILVFFASALR